MLAGSVILKRPRRTATRNRALRAPLARRLAATAESTGPVNDGAVLRIREAKTASHILTTLLVREWAGPVTSWSEGRSCRVFKMLPTEIISYDLSVSQVSCHNRFMKSYRADAARREMRDILTAVEHGEHVEIKRYDTPTAIVVPVEWYDKAVGALASQGEEHQP